MEKKRLPVGLITDMLRSDADSRRRHEFEEWLKEPGNTATWYAVQRLWDEARHSASGYEPDMEKSWKRLRMKIRRATGHGMLFRAAAVAVIVLCLTGTAYFIYSGQFREDACLTSVSSMSGKSRTVLPDGTVVWLNEKSSIDYYRKSFGKKKRDVRLKGEAYFEVAEDTQRPFSVDVEHFTVKVTGTSFNVQECTSMVEVSLSEGAVQLISMTGQKICLSPGQKAVCRKSDGSISMDSGDVSCDVCWAQESLNFKGQPLGTICRYLSKWYGTDVVPSPDLIDNYAYTFTVTDESLDEILEIMSKINPVRYEKDGKGGYHIY